MAVDLSDHVANGVEPISVYDTDGELDGYALHVAPEWWTALRRRYADITDDHVKRLEREARRGDLTRLGPVRGTYSSAWADAAHVRWAPGRGFAYLEASAR